jgi:hypothetical protein
MSLEVQSERVAALVWRSWLPRGQSTLCTVWKSWEIWPECMRVPFEELCLDRWNCTWYWDLVV